jgi:alpha/beta superfamily hydrolase
LRFDFRGVGESAGVASGDLTEAVADYRRVVGWARAQESDWMTFGGYSFGALAAIHTHLDGLDCHAIAAVAPPVQGLTMEMMRRLDCYFALMCGTHDTFIDSYEMMDLLTHVRMAQYSLIETDHFFIGRRDELVDYAEKLARDLTAAKVAPPVSDNEIDPEDLL